MSILDYEFMQRAFLVDVLLAATIPCTDIVMVLKHLLMMGDALPHTSLAGAAAGLVLGISSTLDAVAVRIAAALSIEVICKRIPKYFELSIIIILSAGVGLTGVLSNFVRSAANFNNFPLGSIVAISDFELILVCCVNTTTLVCFLVLCWGSFLIILGECAAQPVGIPVKTINSILTIPTAVTVSAVARTVGTLITSSLMVILVTCVMQITRSYRQTMLWSIVFTLLFTAPGLFLSYYARLRPGATTVLIGVVVLVVVLFAKSLFGARGHADA